MHIHKQKSLNLLNIYMCIAQYLRKELFLNKITYSVEIKYPTDKKFINFVYINFGKIS